MSPIDEKRAYVEAHCWPEWIRRFRETRVLMLPGIMGSQLFDYAASDTVWLDQRFRRDIARLGFQSLTPQGGVDSGSQRVVSDRTVWPPFGGRPYAEFRKSTPCVAYAFDWRESLPVAARRLAKFLRLALAGLPDGEGGQFSVVTHSMGGCLLMALLERTDEFDQRIKNIVCVAPPFHGAIRPIRVVEYGEGAPADFLIRDRDLKAVAATMPGLFQLALAPRGKWVASLPVPGGQAIELAYPVRGKVSELPQVHQPRFWSEPRHPMREAVLRYAKGYHDELDAELGRIQKRVADRFHVIVGINGRNTLSRVTRAPDGWRFHKNGRPKANTYANGDATVLFQSSYLPGFDTRRYWAYASPGRKNIHSKMLDIVDVRIAINKILEGKSGHTLLPYKKFIKQIDFRNELSKSKKPAEFGDLDYQERARLRGVVDFKSWDDHDLRGRDQNDHDLYTATRDAAMRIALRGTTIDAEAKGLGKPVEFLEDFMRRSLMPL